MGPDQTPSAGHSLNYECQGKDSSNPAEFAWQRKCKQAPPSSGEACPKVYLNVFRLVQN